MTTLGRSRGHPVSLQRLIQLENKNKMKSTLNDLKPINPTRPVAAYKGGKRLLAKRLTAIIDNTPHTLYAEPFVGMGGIFFRKNTRAKAESINDISQNITNLFRILQRHYVPFMEMLRWRLSSRAEFDRLLAVNPDTQTDLERAARFLYLQRLAFGGKIHGQNYGVTYDTPSRFDINRVAPMLEEAHDRLAGVNIECLAYDKFIEKYDREGTLFYLDPPYHGHEDDYGKDLFTEADFQKLATQLSTLKGKFIFSINNTSYIKKTFKNFHIDTAKTSYTLAGNHKQKKVTELIISNFKTQTRKKAA